MGFTRRAFMQFFIPLTLFLGTFLTIVITIDDYGITLDEGFYIKSSRSIESWFEHATRSTAYFTDDAVTASWKSALWEDTLSGNVHPPFYKLSAIVFLHFPGRFFFDNIVFQYRVSTAFWASILVVMLFLVVRRFTGSTAWALLGSLSFSTVPRFFADSHFFATDMIISSLGFSGLAVFLFAARPWARVLLAGMLFGAALATKFTGILALMLVVPMIVIAENPKQFLKEYCFMVLLACFFFSIFNFPVLFNPQRELTFYFSSFFNRANRIPITTLYFGDAYNYPPFHQPWVMFGITLPPIMVVTAIMGIIGGTARFIGNRDKFSYVSLAPFLLCMIAYMLPSTPKHDGIRLFSSAWPFIVLLSILGCYWLQGLVHQKYRIGMIISILSLALTVFQLYAYHPYELSYYNRFIGGAKGAQDKGFTVSYWYEAFNKDFFRRVAEIVGNEKAAVYSYPFKYSAETNQAYGLSSTKLHSVEANEDYKYILVYNRFFSRDERESIRQHPGWSFHRRFLQK
jgi:hypothetical protein